ncbi:putative WD repeat-containing protein [Smittium mucronatum]|uniref:Putative WD repeat-containing protein n=1 Tax=Smittium mucronatum TaxID=133383 RepID=A0A1R0GXL6_9FUNG|nr:putative WD repeat-containing protein [Smittium mucronatum]
MSPLTSMDWNRIDSRYIVTSSVDTTCTVWDIETQQTKTQLIAHDREVFDVKFVPHSIDTFYTCGADGSIRMFDLRSLEHSTILFEEPPKFSPAIKPIHNGAEYSSEMASYVPPLLRISTSYLNPNYIASFALDSHSVSIIDIRFPGVVVVKLIGHESQISACEWSPTKRFQLVTSSSDGKVLFWDINSKINQIIKSIQPDTQGSFNESFNLQSNNKTHQSGGVSNYGEKLINGMLSPSVEENLDLSDKITSYSDEIPAHVSPQLNYVANCPVNLLNWNSVKNDWVAIAFGNTVQALRV